MDQLTMLRDLIDEIRSLNEPQVSAEFLALAEEVSCSLCRADDSNHRAWAQRLAEGIMKV